MRRLIIGGVSGVLVCVGVQVVSAADALAHGSPERGAQNSSGQGAANSSARGGQNSSVSGRASCQADGTYAVTWYVTNGDSRTRSVSVSGQRPRNAAVSPSSLTLGPGSSGSISQAGVPGSRTSASLSLRANQSHGRGGHLSGSVTTDGRCRPTHPVGQPVPANGSCASGAARTPSVRIPADSGVTYALDGAPAAPGDQPVSEGTHQVTVSSSRYKLDRSAFAFTVSAARDCTAAATLGSPHVNAPACVTGAAQPSDFTTALPNSNGINYSASPAVHTASGWAVAVSATATRGFRLGSAAPSGWHRLDANRATYTVSVPTPLTCARSTAPTFTAGSCVNGNLSSPSLTVGATPGVDYFADGRQLQAGTHPVADGSSVSITSQAGPGYLLTGSSSFTHAFAGPPVCAGAQLDPSRGVAFGATVGLPVGVTVGATLRASVGGLIPARVLSSAPGCGANCLGPIVPRPAAFNDDHCVSSTGQRSGASFTVPSLTGAIYWVNGSVVSGGTYPAVDGMTVTVVTSPRAGYSLTGITQWTHTFPDAPSCSGVSSKDRTASPPAAGKPNAGHGQDSAAAPRNTATTPSTAFSGTPVAQLTLTGTALLLMGGAACFASGAVRRRWLPVS